MNEQFITDNFCNAEIAKAFEQLGFNEPCIAKRNAYGLILADHLSNTVRNSDLLGPSTAAPTYWQAIAWLRKQGIQVTEHEFKKLEAFSIPLYKVGEWALMPISEAILKAIEILKSQQVQS